VNFTAPTVTVDTALQFQLTVMDDGYATDRDQVVVGVFPPGGSTDVTPPVTTITTVKNRAKGKTDYDVTLASNEPGLTFFKVTGDGTITSGGENTTDLQEYSGTINIALTKGGNGVTFEYYTGILPVTKKRFERRCCNENIKKNHGSSHHATPVANPRCGSRGVDQSQCPGVGARYLLPQRCARLAGRGH
jgi:hypothetical protein